MKFGKGSELQRLGTPSGKGYRTPCLSFSISLSVLNMGRLKDGSRRWQGVNPQDVSTKDMWRSWT